MAELNIAISEGGASSLLAELKRVVIEDTKRLIDDCGAAEGAIRAAWVGEDCDKYLENFKTERESAKNELDSYYTKFEAEFNRIAQEWADFRASNV